MKLPVNATSPEGATRIAVDAADTQTPKGSKVILVVGAIEAVERPARPFAKVALEQANVADRSSLATYIFDVEVIRVDEAAE